MVVVESAVWESVVDEDVKKEEEKVCVVVCEDEANDQPECSARSRSMARSA